jgi:hypothetical protein
VTDPDAPDTLGRPAPDAGADGHDRAAEPEPDVEPSGSGWPTESRVFLGVGAFYLLIGVIYLITSYGEWAGVALLLFSGAFAITIGVWLIKGLRPVQHHVEAEEAFARPGEVAPETGDLYLPVTSVWPLGMGVGVALVLSGFAVGWVAALPGAGLLAHSIIGFANQSRHRDLG